MALFDKILNPISNVLPQNDKNVKLHDRVLGMQASEKSQETKSLWSRIMSAGTQANPVESLAKSPVGQYIGESFQRNVFGTPTQKDIQQAQTTGSQYQTLTRQAAEPIARKRVGLETGLIGSIGQAPKAIKTGKKILNVVKDKYGTPFRKEGTRQYLGHPEDNGGIFYHGTTPENKKSIMKHGIDTSKNKKEWGAEQPEAFYIANKSEAGMYGGDTLVKIKVKPGETVKTMPVEDFTAEQNAKFKRSIDEINWAKKNGYDAINYGDEIAVINPSKFEVIKSNQSGKVNTGALTAGAGAAMTASIVSPMARGRKMTVENKKPLDAEKDIYKPQTITATNYDPFDPRQTKSYGKKGEVAIGEGVINDGQMVAAARDKSGQPFIPYGSVIEMNGKRYLVADTMNKRYNGTKKIDFPTPKQGSKINKKFQGKKKIKILRLGKGKADARRFINSGQWQVFK